MKKDKYSLGNVIAKLHYAQQCRKRSCKNVNSIQHIGAKTIDSVVAYLLNYKKMKENQLTIEEMNFLIENVTFMHDFTEVNYKKEMFKNIVKKLLKQKDILEYEENSD